MAICFRLDENNMTSLDLTKRGSEVPAFNIQVDSKNDIVNAFFTDITETNKDEAFNNYLNFFELIRTFALQYVFHTNKKQLGEVGEYSENENRYMTHFFQELYLDRYEEQNKDYIKITKKNVQQVNKDNIKLFLTLSKERIEEYFQENGWELRRF